jgi:hypothetical protein
MIPLAVLSADDLASALTHGAAGWMVLSVAAVLPILWAFALAMFFARPYVLRFLRTLTLRFGGDVWWLSYVLLRDALLVVVLGLSLIMLFPNLYLKVGLPVTGPLAVVVLFWAIAVKLFRDTDEDVNAFRLQAILLVLASFLYIVPQVYGMEAQDQTNLGSIPANLVSTTNEALAKGILGLSVALFALSAAIVFGRFVYRLWKSEPAGEGASSAR